MALGAPLWADRARAELARVGGHVGSPGTLTPAEGRIAALVAQGRSNKEEEDEEDEEGEEDEVDDEDDG